MDNQTFQNLEKIKAGVASGQLDANLAMRWLHEEIAAGKRREAGEQDPPKLTVNFYLAKLPVESLVSLTHWANRIGDRSPKLGSLIQSWITAELQRRETIEDDDAVPVEPTKPDAAAMLNWSNRELAGALTALVGPSYSVEDIEAGKIIDKINAIVVCLAASRLTLGGN